MNLPISVALLANLLSLLCAVMAVIVFVLFFRFGEGRARTAATSAFIAWLLYAGVLGYKGVIASRVPPGLAFLLVPVALFVLTFLVRHPGVKAFASQIPLQMLIGAQVFRVFVELVLYGLYLNRLVPRLLTFEGGNIEILFALTAPLVAWLYAIGRMSRGAIRAWSIVGVLSLANVVIRAVLTFSGVLQADIPNVGIGLFPFTFIPGFLAPLALCLHVLVLRALPAKTTS